MIKEWFLKTWIKQARWCICRFGQLCLCAHICVCASSGNPGSMVSAQRFHGKKQLRGNTGLPGWLKRSYITGGDAGKPWSVSQRREEETWICWHGHLKDRKANWSRLNACTNAYLLFCEPMKGVGPPFTEHLLPGDDRYSNYTCDNSKVLISPTLLSYSIHPGPTIPNIWLHVTQFFSPASIWVKMLFSCNAKMCLLVMWAKSGSINETILDRE